MSTDKLIRRIALVYLAVAAVAGAADIFYILRHYTIYPFGDHWIWIGRIYRRGVLGALAQQINEHRLTVPGVFYFLDHRYFGGVNALLISVSMLVQIAGIALMVIPLWRAEVPGAVRYVFAGFVTILSLWFIQGENFFYPFSMCLSCANLGILAALYFFSSMVTGSRRSGLASVAAVAACGFWATYSYGHGMLIWPVLLAVGFVAGLPRRTWLALLAASVAAIGLYFVHYVRPAGSADPLLSLLHPVRLLHYVVVMLALPFFGPAQQDAAFANHIGSYLASIAGILAALIFLARFALHKSARETRAAIVYSSVVLLTLASAFITALGRSNFPIEQALSDRYAPVPLLFWFSLMALIATYLNRTALAAWCAVLIVASLATLPAQPTLGSYFAVRERQQSAAAISILVGVPDNARIHAELSDPPLVDYVEGQTKLTLGRSMFARPEADLLGTPIARHFQIGPADTCLGFVDLVEPVPSAKIPGAALTGWAWNARRNRDTTRIWVADTQGIIRGLGVTRISRPDVAAAYHQDGMQSAGWLAYAPLAPGETLTVYAGLDDGHTVCQVGSPRGYPTDR